MSIEMSVRRTVVLFLLMSGVALAQQDDAAARRLFDLANQARSDAGAGELQWDDRLAAAAAEHAREMARRGQLSHQFPGEQDLRRRLIATGLRSDASAENVGLASTAGEVHSGWMRSPGHRQNLLNPLYNAAGIAVIRRGRILYAVQDFARRVASYSDQEVEAIVATQFTRARSRAGLRDLKFVQASDVHAAACGMAHDGQMEASSLVSRLSRVRGVFTFTTAEPQRLPESLVRTASDATSFAVGSCFGKTDRFPEGTNWVVVAFY